jgi:4-amino-4-deoxy-L-arabinose transferase-like glycosyltransferase
VFSLARSPMPDMTFALMVTASLAAFAEAEFGMRRSALVTSAALAGLASLAKGPAAIMAPLVAVVYATVAHGGAGLRRLVSVPAGLVFAAIAVPWWLFALQSDAATFTNEIVRHDWIRWYLAEGRASPTLVARLAQAMAVLLPWSPLLPFAAFGAVRRVDGERRKSRVFLLVWLAVIFALVGAAYEQRLRYYLPLCPPVAILIAEWLAPFCHGWRGRVGAAVFSLGIVALCVGQVVATERYNAGTDLRALETLTRGTDAALYAVGVPELSLAFYLHARVVRLRQLSDLDMRHDRSGQRLVILPAGTPVAVSHAWRHVGDGRLNGRAIAVLAVAE